jgi:hypothetical protein
MGKAGRPLGVFWSLRRSPALVLAALERSPPGPHSRKDPGMSVSLERLARNQALFREVNERLLELSESFQDGSMHFVCECSSEDCTLTINMNHKEYESVRSHSTFFVIATGHEILEIEKIIDRHDGWTIVQKVAESDYAVETDPRRRNGA